MKEKDVKREFYLSSKSERQLSDKLIRIQLEKCGIDVFIELERTTDKAI